MDKVIPFPVRTAKPSEGDPTAEFIKDVSETLAKNVITDAAFVAVDDSGNFCIRILNVDAPIGPLYAALGIAQKDLLEALTDLSA